jgi:hypothetical protein
MADLDFRRPKRRVKIVQSEKDAPRGRLSEMDQKLADQSVQLRRFKRGRRDELDALKQGEHGAQWKALSQILRHLTLSETMYLPEYIERQDWLLESDLHARNTALSVIHGAIIRERIRNGYSPMDDGLPGEPPTALEMIRSLLKIV